MTRIMPYKLNYFFGIKQKKVMTVMVILKIQSQITINSYNFTNMQHVPSYTYTYLMINNNR